jgi:hypothetical protein
MGERIQDPRKRLCTIGALTRDVLNSRKFAQP